VERLSKLDRENSNYKREDKERERNPLRAPHKLDSIRDSST